jgi:prevent-host-death family protein
MEANAMKLSEDVKSISYLKAHASEILKDVSRNRKTMVITQNGEARAILQDIKMYEEIQESLALLKILALSNKNKEKRKYKSVENSFRDIRENVNKWKPE